MASQNGRLANKRVLVTGAAGTIGSAVCRAVTAQGGLAITLDLAEGADHRLDVTSEAAWIALADKLAGPLDGLVNTAGIARAGTIEDTDFAIWKAVLASHLDGTFLACKHLFPHLKQRGGSIVNLSSVAGLVGIANLAAYGAAKGGVRALTKSIALHGARCDPPVRCNSVHPAFLDGPMVDQVLEGTGYPDAARARLTREIPLGRFGTGDEIADLCVYLLSDESRFVTGAEFAIDGGLTAR